MLRNEESITLFHIIAGRRMCSSCTCSFSKEERQYVQFAVESFVEKVQDSPVNPLGLHLLPLPLYFFYAE